MKRTIEVIETNFLAKFSLEYDKSIKVLNILIGGILATRSINEITYSKSVASQLFFLLSCVNGATEAISSTRSLFNESIYNQCSTPITALVANSMAISFYLAGKQAENKFLENLPQPVPSPVETPNFQKILPGRGGNQKYLHQSNQTIFFFNYINFF